MEQRIKLRAWHKKENRWIKISGFKLQSGELLPWEYRQEGFSTVEWVYVDDFELVEFTGRIDNWKNEIWEGDTAKILYTDWPSKSNDDPRTLDQYLEDIAIPGEIVFHEGAFCLMVDNLKYGGKDYLSLDPGKHGFIKVTGNKFQHPELLTQPA